MSDDDRGLAALAAALWPELAKTGLFVAHVEEHARSEAREMAAAILGDHAVFWPTGTEEYRELIRQYQAEIARLRDALEEISGDEFSYPMGGPAQTMADIARITLEAKP